LNFLHRLGKWSCTFRYGDDAFSNDSGNGLLEKFKAIPDNDSSIERLEAAEVIIAEKEPGRQARPARRA